MNCPNCNSTQIRKNGHRLDRQCYQCKSCSRQFLEFYKDWKYPEPVKQVCLKMYLNGMGLRAIERVTEIHHTTVMHWIREAAATLPHAPQVEELPEITELDERFWEELFPPKLSHELQTFVGCKQNKY